MYKGKTKEIYEITVENQIIKASALHRFYIIDKGWIKAKDLKEGDAISAKNNSLVIKKVEKKINEEDIPIYNLTIDDFHTYVITEYELLVHNANSNIGGTLGEGTPYNP